MQILAFDYQVLMGFFGRQGPPPPPPPKGSHYANYFQETKHVQP